MKTTTLLLGILSLLLLLGCASQPSEELETPTEQTPVPPVQEPVQETPAPQVEQIPQTEQTPTVTGSPSEPEQVPVENTPATSEPQTEKNESTSTSERCKDTDVTEMHPDGINFEIQGNITINGKRLINGGDYCPNIMTISEWYCDGNAARVKTQRCPSDARCYADVCG